MSHVFVMIVIVASQLQLCLLWPPKMLKNLPRKTNGVTRPMPHLPTEIPDQMLPYRRDTSVKPNAAATTTSLVNIAFPIMAVINICTRCIQCFSSPDANLTRQFVCPRLPCRGAHTRRQSKERLLLKAYGQCIYT